MQRYPVILMEHQQCAFPSFRPELERGANDFKSGSLAARTNLVVVVYSKNHNAYSITESLLILGGMRATSVHMVLVCT